MRYVISVAALSLAGVSSLRADVINDDFLGADVSPEWTVSFEHSTQGIFTLDWTYEMRDGWLIVTDIEPDRRVDEPELSGSCRVILSRSFHAPGEFSVSTTLSWDSEDNARAMQTLVVRLRSDTTTVHFGYADSWIVHRGGRNFGIIPHDEDPLFRSEKNALPYAGSANISLDRTADGLITARWEGAEFFSATETCPIDMLQIVFSYAPYRRAFLGELGVDFIAASSSGGNRFRRGDSNADGTVNIGDGVYILQNLFSNGPDISCPDAADANDDEIVNIADAVYILLNLFAAGLPIPEPHATCGLDSTSHPLGEPDLPPCEYPAERCP